MKYTQIHILYITAIILAVVLFFKNCDSKTKTVTKTTVNITKIKDSIKNVLIKELKPVYIDTGSTKYIKGDTKYLKAKTVIKWRDSIVYVDKPTNTTIKANQFEANLSSNDATANLKITTTGELLDVQGVIEYPEVTITKTITKTKAKSGLFIYGLMPINESHVNVEVGLMYQFKNSIMLMGGAQYNEFTNSADLKVGLGIKLF